MRRGWFVTSNDLPRQPLLDNMDFPRIKPRMPRPGTLEYKAIMMMLGGEVLNRDTFHAKTGSHSLPQVINPLRNDLWAIDGYDLPVPLHDLPDRKLTHYYLDLSKIELPDELGAGAAQ